MDVRCFKQREDVSSDGSCEVIFDCYENELPNDADIRFVDW